MKNIFTPLRVTAHLANGFASNDPWSPGLDAILAYWAMRERLGEEDFAAGSIDSGAMQPVEGLPLAVEKHGDWWWYQCSAPIYETAAEFSRYFHRRFDSQMAERYLQPKKGRVDTKCGPFKAYRLSARVTVCDRVEWHCIGDAAEIGRLLRRCSAIGYKTGAGHGRVLRWEVGPGGEADLARFHRPLPVDFAQAHGIEGPQLQWSIRPPGRITINQALCVMPGGDDHARR